MKKLSFYLLPLLALASAGCEKESEGGAGDSTQFTIVASTDGAILPNWKAQDEIVVVCDDEMYTFTADAPGKTANFTEAEKLLSTQLIGSNPAV